ncbi:transglycosylase SLT domain-containing protein [Rhodospirillaceae bacterium SYSU D60014]|uniref:transglycosylase SLT domain-containing protein n=1 Tax=Virgifigura deserti TaxID=2268457 RepID=UPI000E660291
MSVGPIHGNSAELRGVSPQITSAIQMASLRSGVDFSYLVTKAAMESGFDPHIQAKTSSATGLYQFIDQTWLDMVKTHGAKYGLGGYATALESGHADDALKQKILDLREDPKISAFMAAEYTRGNRNYLEGTVGGRIGDTELYLAHFLGPGGAEKFLRALRADPGQDAASILPQAAEANRAIFYRNGQPLSLEDVYDRFAAKFADRAIAAAGPTEAGRQPIEPDAQATASAGGAEAGSTRPSHWMPSPVQSPGPALRMSYATQLYLLSLSMPGGEPDEGSV